MEFLRLLVDVIETLVWPGVAVWLLGFVFREQVKELTNRISKIGPEGVEIGNPQPEAVRPPNPEEQLEQALENAPPAVQREVTLYKEQLDQLDQAGKLVDGREVTLLRALAESNVALHFERTYSAIWGSQLGALEDVNVCGGSAPMNLVKYRYDTAAKSNSDVYQRITFEQWLSFMRSSKLVEVTDDQITITDVGKLFLVYLTDHGYTRIKIL